jgi:putative transposase
MTSPRKVLRCAIYTRKSTEHNLDLAFNSLDGQREACEAYIKSQAREGWRLVRSRYDDGGLSGASLDRALPCSNSSTMSAAARSMSSWSTTSTASPVRWRILPSWWSRSTSIPSRSYRSPNPSILPTAWADSPSTCSLSFAQFEREVIDRPLERQPHGHMPWSLMAGLGLQGVIRGKPVRTTISDKAVSCPLDHVNRHFHAPRPNALWVADFTYVATWTGFVYVAFVIDAYARRIVGWRVSRTAHAGFVLDALEQALHDRRPVHRGGPVHRSDRGSQYVSIKYTERLAEAGVEPSVGSVGDSYDNALAETINGLYKAEVIHRRGPWRSFQAVEFATLEWVDWFNNRRLLEPIGNIPPVEAEERYYATLEETAMAA